MDRALQELDPFLRAIAAVARGEEAPREKVEAGLAQLEENGWRLTEGVHRIWSGERDGAALGADVDPNSAALLRRILELIEAPTPEEALAAAPAPVREAIEANDTEALNAALRDLPPEEAEEAVDRLRDAGLVGEVGSSGPDMERVLQEFDPFLRAVAALARGEEGPRDRVEEALREFEKNGWQLSEPVRRIQEGERDPEALTEGLDVQDSRVVRRILELIDAPAPGEALAAAPAPVREAVEAEDHEALQSALASLPEEEASRVVASLLDAGILSPK
ncbi:MAG: hypothetical protein ACLF0P_04325 [Thermoanaerobaculia bacterium]